MAKSSLTNDGIVYVIDHGFANYKVLKPRIRVEYLLVSPILNASANKKVGRTCPGKCFCLFNETSFKNELTKDTYPEIIRANIVNIILTLKKIGINDKFSLCFMDHPTPETLMNDLELLNYVCTLNDEI